MAISYMVVLRNEKLHAPSIRVRRTVAKHLPMNNNNNNNKNN